MTHLHLTVFLQDWKYNNNSFPNLSCSQFYLGFFVWLNTTIIFDGSQSVLSISDAKEISITTIEVFSFLKMIDHIFNYVYKTSPTKNVNEVFQICLTSGKKIINSIVSHNEDNSNRFCWRF